MKAGIFRVMGCIVLVLIASGSSGQTEPLAATRLTPDEIKWEREPSGVQRASLVGDDKKPGMYMYRVRFPANHKVQPHFHPDERVVTVISGTLYVGYGEQFDESAMKDRAGQATALCLCQRRRGRLPGGRQQRALRPHADRAETTVKALAATAATPPSSGSG
jgi:hypothetical protein